MSVERRPLHFDSLDAVLAEAEWVAAGPHRTLGRWTVGQIFAHLAKFMQQSLDGFEFRVPVVMRLMARPFRRRFIERAWPSGIKLPRRAAAVLSPPEVSTEEGLERLRTMIGRLKAEPQRAPSPIFGKMTCEQWDRLHCRHAELHMGFVIPGVRDSGGL